MGYKQVSNIFIIINSNSSIKYNRTSTMFKIPSQVLEGAYQDEMIWNPVLWILIIQQKRQNIHINNYNKRYTLKVTQVNYSESATWFKKREDLLSVGRKGDGGKLKFPSMAFKIISENQIWEELITFKNTSQSILKIYCHI